MLTEGMFIADRYEIIGKVGAGGMSDVYKAKDHVLGRFVAIKVLKQEFSEDVNFVTKFRTEAQSAAGLEHPNIVNIYDVGSENGMHYIVMEFVEGITLKTYIEKKGRLTYKEAVSIAIQVGRGIETAHNKNIVHRDIKPQNIIISTEGKVKVTDFGIARAATTNTINSDVMGSVHYSSPEQARNGFVDGKSDIYSLGIVMYEMVTGRVPFDGDTTVAVAIQHLQEEIVAPSAYVADLPISLEKIILKCTQKNPDRRYDSMESLLMDLKKSLISPNEDFVSIVPMGGNGKTRVIGEDELARIKERTSQAAAEADEDDELDEELDEDDENEGKEGLFLNPKMDKAVTIMGIAAIAVIVIIVVCLVGNILGIFRFGGSRNNDTETEKDTQLSTDTENMSEMIDLRGLTLQEARELLEEKELNIVLKEGDTVSSETFEEGQIAEQSVEKGDMVAEGDTVTVRISSGTGDIPIPNVIGYNYEDAKKALENLGFRVGSEYAQESDLPPESVISVTPNVGDKAKEGDTVTLVLAPQIEKIRVSSVTNMTQEEAESTLTAQGLVVNVNTDYSENIEKGRVISQDKVNEYVNKGTTVTIVVSLGKKTTYYSFKSENLQVPADDVSKPGGDKTYTGGTVTLKASDGSVLWTTDFNGTNPGSVSVDNIAGYSSGTLEVLWNYTLEDGNTGTNLVGPTAVSFTAK
ncbi:MAG: Stk1 family PASTA domain-containing Ser/Thr kinase [Lachnospiraceae bacterium]|nr:Stk1 family PASTA domain-containing Ser/Thr kinase [Lachnospiraceae bacterium]